MLNFNSPVQLRAFLFGGTIKLTLREPHLNSDGTFKLYNTGKHLGKIRMKNVIKTVEMKGFGISPKPHWKTATGLISTSYDVINELFQLTKDMKTEELQDLNKICSILLETSGLDTILSTYYNGHRELIYPDGMLRGNFQHCSTITGRLSCSKPNVQNLTDPVTEHLVSRY